MTNAQIIFENQMLLYKEGKLKATGRTVKAYVNDEEVDLPEIEPIHTFQMWKELGFKVKKGEKAIAKFTIWKYSGAKKKPDEDKIEISEDGHCFMKNACFFSLSQVEKAG